ncbi:filamentous hemagglutinin N-terminal domain-containing protein [Reyranella sp. CPCC 100927]|uniref:filamentous hemagglutinin N-terminal domain-containing protein n=1 Tax=Reyranella sp. CPCC 100927 TaxID=2599616 RepID=UPI0011B35EC0|nr:filamentous hemagglutinin N-terminal domain-containing protein [Reyranella sp. CPCC 100927]TWT08716.1 filamentous hemagglutinin N-terminal domain-containing protein [Reyranella sp. CPCC 100927]
MAKGEARAGRARRARSAAIQVRRGQARRGRGDLLAGTALAFLVGCGLFTFSGPASAQVSGVTGGTVVGGSATIANTTRGHVTVTQSTDRGIIDWRSFSIGAGERVDFVQPRTSSVTLNRVTGPDPSVIAGSLSANGQLILVNGAGVVFANGAQVNAAGLVAATSNIVDPQRFMQGGTVTFDRPSSDPNAGVVNAGTITVRDGGLVGLVGNTASNSGTINARLGHVTIGGAETFTVDLAGDGLINFQLGKPVSRQPVDPQGNKRPLVSNTGTINADGGVVTLSARAARGVVDNVVNAGGTINARAVRNEGGVVVFGGDEGATVNVTGTVDVSGGHGQRGGQVVASAAKGTVNVAATARINASGGAGGGTVQIGGSKQGQGPVANAKNTTVASGATIRADATGKGNGGTVIVWADNATVFGGTVSAQGGPQGGDGGFTEVSGKVFLDFKGQVDLRAPHGVTGTLLLDPSDIVIASGTNDTTQTGNVITGKSDTSILDVDVLIAALKLANVTVDAAGGGGKGSGSITVANAVISTSDNSLTLNALADITLNADINVGTGTLAFISTKGALVGSSGAVTAGAVTLNMGGAVTLDNAGNKFGNISGTSGGAITVVNNGALVVGGNLTAGKDSAISITTTGATSDLTITGALSGTGINLTAGGKLTGAGAVDGGTSSVALTADGDVGLSGKITATGLTAKSGDDVTLNNTDNTFGTFQTAAAVAGKLTIVHKGDLALGAVQAGGDIGITTNTGGNLTVGDVIATTAGLTLTASGALTGAGNITGTTLSLSSGAAGGIALTGVITGTSLAVASAGVVSLTNTANAFNIFSTTSTIAGDIVVMHGGALTLNKVNGGAQATFKTGVGGITVADTFTTAGDVTLAAASALSINAAVNLGTASIALSGTTVTQTTAGAISAKGLAVTATAGNIDLTLAVNAVETLAASAVDGSVGFTTSGALAIGSVGAIGGITAKTDVVLSAGGAVTQTKAVTAAGLAVTTTAGDIDLTQVANAVGTLAAKAAGGSLGFKASGALAIGSVGGIDGITAKTNVVLDAGGAVTQDKAVVAVGLAVTAAGDITLTDAGNKLTTFAASSTGAVSLQEADGVTIGTVTALGALSAVSGITADTDVTLTSTAVSQTADGAIKAANLAVTATTGDIDLTQATSTVGTLAASAAGGSVGFKTSDALVIGSVGGIDGITAKTNVVLDAGGAVTQTNAVTAAGLAVTAAGDITLTDTNNKLATFAAAALTGAVSLQEADGFAVGAVASLGALAKVSGITAGADVTLSSTSISQTADGAIKASSLVVTATTGNIDLTQATSTVDTLAASAVGGSVGFKTSGDLLIGSVGGVDGITAKNNVMLNAGGGVTQDKAVIASGLAVTAQGDITLAHADNKFTTFAASSTGAVSLQHAEGVAVGTVTAVGALSAVSGITAGSNITLDVAGALAINAAITADGDVALRGLSIAQAAGATIKASGLAATATDGDVGLAGAANTVATFAAEAAKGNVALKASGDLVIGAVAGVTGITTSALGTVTLVATSGAVTQTHAIITDTLDIGTTGPASLALTLADNRIGTVKSTAGLGTGAVSVVDGDGGLVVREINGQGALALRTSGKLSVEGALNTAAGNGNITLTSIDNAVSINAPLSAGTGTVALTSGGLGDITATTAAIAAGRLTLETGADGKATITGSHNIAALSTTGIGIGSGGLVFQQGRLAGFSVGPVTAAGTIAIDTGGALQVAGQIKAVGKTVMLVADGPITQTGGAGVTAAELSAVTTVGNIDLDTSSNTVSVFAAKAIGGSVSFKNSGGFDIGSVGTINGITANSASGAVTLQAAAGTITQTQAITTRTLNVTTAGASVTLDHGANNARELGTINVGAGSFTFVDNAGIALNVGTIIANGGISITNSSGDLSTSAFLSTGGSVSLIASGDLTISDSIVAGSNIALTSQTGKIVLSGGEVTSNTGGITLHSREALDTGTAVITAANPSGGNVSLISDQGQVTVGGNVTVGDTLTIQIGAGLLLTVTGEITAPSVSLFADQMDIRAKINATTSGTITLAPVSKNTQVTIGDTASPVGLHIDNSELAFLTSASTLTIGKSDTGALRVADATVANGALNLITAAGITQTGLLTVGGGTGTLDVTAGGTVNLNGTGVVVGTVGGSTTSGDFLVIRSNGTAGDMVVSGITTQGGEIGIRNFAGDLIVSGALSSNGGTILLGSFAAGSALRLNATVDAGAGSVGLFSASGGISQGGGRIVAADLLATIVDPTGDIVLSRAGNSVTGRVTLSAGAAGGNINFTNSSSYQVGGFASLSTAVGTLTAGLGSGLRTASSGSISLIAGGDITQASGTGHIVSTGTLSIARAAGSNPNVTLNNAGNDVASLGAISIGQGAFTLINAGDLTLVGDGRAGGGYTVSTSGALIQQSGVTIDTSKATSGAVTDGNVSLAAGTGRDIVLNDSITAGAAGVIALRAGGSVRQFSGAVTAGNVEATALAGSVSLISSANAFDVISGSGALGFSAVTTRALTIGVDGIQSASGSVSLSTIGAGHDITVDNKITATKGTVSLVAGGSIFDTAAGGITAASLQASAVGSVDLSQAAASNNVSAVGGSASGNFTYVDNNTPLLTAGKITAGGNVTLQSNGNLNVAGALTANASTGRISLTSVTGSIVETASGSIAAAELLAFAQVNVDIAQSTNVVGAKGFAAQATTGFVVFRNSGAIELDQVGGVNGVTAGGAVFISTTSGNISQTSKGIITAGAGLGLEAQNGSVLLTEANVVTGNVAVANTTNGNVVIRTVGDLNIGTVGPINTAGLDVPTLNGITASTAAGKFVSLISDTGAIAQSTGAKDGIVGGELRISTNNKDATLGNANNQLVAVGDVNLGSGKFVLFDSAGGLDVRGTVQANGGVDLTTQGGLLTVPGTITATNGDISLVNKAGAVIAQGSIIAGDGSVSITAQGAITAQGIITTAKGDILLTAQAGALAVEGSVSTTNGNISLASLTSGISLSSDVSASGQLQLNAKGGLLVQTAGTITAQSLVANALGNVELVQAGNDVVTVAGGSTTGTFRYRDATAITVAGITTAGQDITLVAGDGGASGGIAVNAAINAGAGTVRLQTGLGDISQTAGAAITAGALLANAVSGLVQLDGSTNAVGNVAGSALGNTFALKTGGAVTITSVGGDGITIGAGGIAAERVVLAASSGNITQTASGVIAAGSLDARASGAGAVVALDVALNAIDVVTGAGSAGFRVTSAQSLTVGVGGVTSVAGSVTLTAAGVGSDLAVDGIVSAAGSVSLVAARSITGSSTGGVQANALLAVAVDGSVDLTNGAANHNVATVAGSAKDGFSYGNSGALTVGTVGSTVGVASATGDVTISTASGNLSLAAGVNANAASGTVSLTSTAGSIVSTTAAGLVAGNRGVLRAGVNVDLARAGNAIGAGGLAGRADGGFFVLSSSTAIHVDTVGGVAGITSAGATILTAGSGSITQAAAIAAGGGLGARADNGNVVLDQSNAVSGNFFGAAAGGSVTFRNAGAVNIGAVGVTSQSGGVIQGNGVTASVAFGQVVSLQSDNGTVGQDAVAGARIVGGELRIVTASRDAMLVNTSNAIEAVGNTNLGTGKLTVFDSTGGLTLSAPVIADGGVILTTQGAFTLPGSIVVANGDISLTSMTAGINLGSTLSAVNGQVQLVAGGSGAITQAGGTITARSLIVRAPGDIDLVQSGNDIGVIAGASGTGTFRYRDATAATIGTLVDSTGTVVSGVTTANRDITIVGGDGGVSGGIAINAAINAGTGTVRLQTGQGDITQAAASPITAQALLAVALHGSVELGGSINNIVDVAGAALGSTFTLRNAGGVTVTGVAGDTITSGANGIVANNGDILLQGRGSIVLAGMLNAANGNATAGPGAGNITLLAEGGSVTQVGSAAIVGNDLRVDATGNVDLANAANDVVRIAGISRTGTFRYRDANALTIDAIGGIAGITANDHDIGIHAGGDLTLNQAVDARGAAGTTTAVVRLQATNGNITQSAAGNVIAGTLLANTVGAGDIVLTNHTNLVRSGAGGATGNPGFVAGTAAGNFRFINGNDLTVNNMAVIGDAGLGINGATGVTAGTGRLVDLGVSIGDLDIQGPVGAVAGMLLYRRVAGAPVGDITVGGAAGNPGNGVGGAYLVVVDLTGSSSLGLTGLTESGAGSVGAPRGLFTTPTPPTTQFPSGLGGPNSGGQLTVGALQGLDAAIYLAGGATSMMTSTAPGFFGILGVYAQEGSRVNLQSVVRAIPNTTIRPIGPFGPNDPGAIGSPPDVVARDFVRKGGLPSINQRFNNCVIAGPSCTTIFTQIANPPTAADDAVIGVAGSSLDDSSIILVNQGNEDFIEDDDEERRRAQKR